MVSDITCQQYSLDLIKGLLLYQWRNINRYPFRLWLKSVCGSLFCSPRVVSAVFAYIDAVGKNPFNYMIHILPRLAISCPEARFVEGYSNGLNFLLKNKLREYPADNNSLFRVDSDANSSCFRVWCPLITERSFSAKPFAQFGSCRDGGQDTFPNLLSFELCKRCQ